MNEAAASTADASIECRIIVSPKNWAGQYHEPARNL